MFSETDINILEFLIDSIFVMLGVFQQTDVQTVILFSPTCSFIRKRQTSYMGFSRKRGNKLARSFNFTFGYIDDVLSLNNSRLGDFFDRIYPIGLEEKYPTDTNRSTSYLDLHLEIDNEGWLRTIRYVKRDYLNVPIVNFPFICSNIPAATAYGVYISQLIRCSRVCGS